RVPSKSGQRSPLTLMVLVICPGIHEPGLTEEFLYGLDSTASTDSLTLELVLVFPTEEYPAYSSWEIVNFLQHNLQTDSPLATTVTFLSFSAGVVGAMGAAWIWQGLGGQVKALIAIDGWGVPRLGNFPCYRLSHDAFTHWSSSLLGTGDESFYADPGVEHLRVWRSPHTVQGWWLHQNSAGIATASPTTAARVIRGWLGQGC
ncbi:MAG: hypothetical protein ACRC8A_06090, partial [Microcoleaceae cyanobacterium]